MASSVAAAAMGLYLAAVFSAPSAGKSPGFGDLAVSNCVLGASAATSLICVGGLIFLGIAFAPAIADCSRSYIYLCPAARANSASNVGADVIPATTSCPAEAILVVPLTGTLNSDAAIPASILDTSSHNGNSAVLGETRSSPSIFAYSALADSSLCCSLFFLIAETNPFTAP